MELTRHCKGCACSLCRWQGTDNCLNDVYPFCDRCRGDNRRVDRYLAMAWECSGFIRIENRRRTNDRT